MFICILHVPPLTTECTGISPKTQIVVFVRIYLVGRFLRQKHELMNSQSTRFLASVTKTELSSMFLFKTFFMQYPFQMIFLGYTILLFIGGYGLWLIEDRYTYLVRWLAIIRLPWRNLILANIYPNKVLMTRLGSGWFRWVIVSPFYTKAWIRISHSRTSQGKVSPNGSLESVIFHTGIPYKSIFLNDEIFFAALTSSGKFCSP